MSAVRKTTAPWTTGRTASGQPGGVPNNVRPGVSQADFNQSGGRDPSGRSGGPRLGRMLFGTPPLFGAYLRIGDNRQSRAVTILPWQYGANRLYLSVQHLLLAAFLLPSSFASGTLPAPRESRLRLFHTHTHERLDVVYSRDGVYDLKALAQLDRFLADHRVGTIKHYDPRLFDLLTELAAKAMRPEAEIHVICGYRTPATNAGLRSRSSAVAKASLHMLAEAIDVRLPGVRTSRLRDMALALGRGGVGYYASSDFLHVDIGRVRRW